jgi:dihydropteroate synthase
MHFHTLTVCHVVNLTPDSFSDGGQWLAPQAALVNMQQAYAGGVRWFDLGAESTQPGALAVPADVQLERLMPVLALCNAQLPADVIISIDTRLADVAAATLAAGAHWINDVSGLTFDPAMAATVAQYKAGAIIMHSQGTPRVMQHNPTYSHVVTEVTHWLQQQRAVAIAAGIAPHKLLVDPGFGFGKTGAHNLQLFNALGTLQQQMGNTSVLVGVSRKSFLTLGQPIPPLQRDGLTQAATLLAWQQGIRWFRAHDGVSTLHTLALGQALAQAAQSQPLVTL